MKNGDAITSLAHFSGRSMIAHNVISADGTCLHVREAGKADGPPLLLIHGWSQHHLSWLKQLRGALAAEFCLIAPDLRGHGASEKPLDPTAYNHSQPWADDIAVIIETMALDQPVLVGWSMGGWVAMDYLRIHGDAAIGGLALIGSAVVTAADPAVAEQRSPAVKAEGMYSNNQETALTSTIAFLKACFAAPLSKQDLALMTGFNMLVPPEVRKAARLRPEDYREEAGALRKPAAVFWGEAERVCSRAMVDATLAAMPHATLHTYPGAGHAPFWERPEAFDSDLMAFARRCQMVTA